MNDFSATPVDNNAIQHQQSTFDSPTIDQQSSMIDVIHSNQTREESENHSDNSNVDITTVDELETNSALTMTHSMY